ncbi:MAG: insulinase family protein, partial [Bacteroidota bacterium]
SLSAYITGSVDPGLFVISGRTKGTITPAEAEKHVDDLMSEFLSEGPGEQELEKVRNQAETLHEFSEVEVMNRAMNLAYSALLGDPDLINSELAMVRKVTADDIKRAANGVVREDGASVLYYNRKN